MDSHTILLQIQA